MNGVLLIDPETPLPRKLWAELIRWRAGHRCEGCGSQFDESANQYGLRLVAHHVNEDDGDNRLANGDALCSRCHRSRHNPGGDDPAERSARAKRAWVTRRANGTVNSRFARMTAAEHTAKAKKGAATRRAKP